MKNPIIKHTLKYTALIGGSLLLFYTIFMSLTANFNIGMVALALISIFALTYGMIFNKIEKLKWLHIAVCAACLSLALFSSFLFIYGYSDNSQYDEDALIVLGSGISGETVGPNLAKRLDKAVEYHLKNPQALIIVSGGQGPQEDITEALAMERYLVDKGIPIEYILKEESSASTYENFKFSNELLKEKFPQGCSVVFITNRFHIYRAENFAKQVGVDCNHVSANTALHSVPMNYIREMLAVLHLWVF